MERGGGIGFAGVAMGGGVHLVWRLTLIGWICELGTAGFVLQNLWDKDYGVNFFDTGYCWMIWRGLQFLSNSLVGYARDFACTCRLGCIQCFVRG